MHSSSCAGWLYYCMQVKSTVADPDNILVLLIRGDRRQEKEEQPHRFGLPETQGREESGPGVAVGDDALYIYVVAAVRTP